LNSIKGNLLAYYCQQEINEFTQTVRSRSILGRSLRIKQAISFETSRSVAGDRRRRWKRCRRNLLQVGGATEEDHATRHQESSSATGATGNCHRPGVWDLVPMGSDWV